LEPVWGINVVVPRSPNPLAGLKGTLRGERKTGEEGKKKERNEGKMKENGQKGRKTPLK